MRRAVVLRPEPGASATVDKAREMGLDAVAVALFAIEPIDWEAPDAASFDGLLLTSANAVRCAGEGLKAVRGLRAYAVGEATAAAARDAGFDIASTGDAGAERLLGSIEPGLKLLHLCGEDRADVGEERQEIARVPVYRAKALEHPDLSSAADAVVLVHSPRAGSRFAGLVGNRSEIVIAAISQAAAEAAGAGWADVQVAAQPTDAALLALAASLCKTPAQHERERD